MSDAVHDQPLLPERIAEFRRSYRQRVIGRLYSGWLHLAFVVVGSMSLIIVALAQIDNDPKPILLIDFITIPITLFFANLVEFFGHRGPMHHRRPARFLELLFHRHTEEHHQFFTDDWMTCRSSRDFKIVLFPPIMLFTYLGLLALPGGLLMGYLIKPNIGYLVVASSMFYFLSYEVLHFTYHIDENTFVGRRWMVRVLREHHRIHHDQQLMSRHNFNITWPVADWLFGTTYEGQTRPPAERASQRSDEFESTPADATTISEPDPVILRAAPETATRPA